MRNHPLLRLLATAHHHRTQVWLASGSSILNKIFDLAPPLLIGMAVDVVVEREASLLARAGVEDLMMQLWVLAAITIVIWVLESVFEFLQRWWWRNLAQAMQHELRVDAFGHVLGLDLGWFQDQSTGRLLAILNDDVNQLERFLDGGANALLQVGTTVVVIGAAFGWVSPGVALLSFLPIPIILWGSFRFQRMIAPRYARVRETSSRVSGQLADALGGMETVKSFVAETREVERVRDLSESYLLANQSAIGPSSAFSPLIRMAILVGFTATLVYGGQQTLEGHIDVGSYSVLVFLTQRLLWPFTSLGEVFDLYQRAMASTERILDLLDEPPTIAGGTQTLPAVVGEVRFEGLTFSYPERAPVLREIDLRIPAGSTIGIVGATGSGKSTLLRLLLRFFEAQDGRVTVDGHDVRDLTLATLRQAVGLVSQHVYLFPGSVRENIIYGRPDATDEAIRAALRAAEADTFVDALPDGIETQIGERGQRLSGGQRQRLSIARAVLTDPPILILDEATSAVDNETERAIQRSLKHIATGRTTILVAHRLSTLVHADNIVVLEEGQIVEEGTHDALIARDGPYARLWSA